MSLIVDQTFDSFPSSSSFIGGVSLEIGDGVVACFIAMDFFWIMFLLTETWFGARVISRGDVCQY